ncbi:MAG TPA: phage tail protein [Rhizomicrobium sp.]|jgi:hypothetical protein
MRRAIFAASLALAASAAGPSEAQGVGTRIGTIIAMGAKFCPPGWAQADGEILPIAEYVDLFYVIGNKYGGDGQNTFALPNLKGGTFGPAKPPLTWCIATAGEAPMPMNKPPTKKSSGHT